MSSLTSKVTLNKSRLTNLPKESHNDVANLFRKNRGNNGEI
jgi:hypothetical protein